MTAPFAPRLAPPDPRTVGEYRSFQSRVVVEQDGNNLVVTSSFDPVDDDHAETMARRMGMSEQPVSQEYLGVAPGQFVPAPRRWAGSTGD